MKKFILSLILCMLMISCVTALDFDNVKTYDSLNDKYTITNAFGLGDRLAEYELTSNTNYCLTDCEATGIAKLYSSAQLFSKMEFENKVGDLTEVDYKIYYEKEITYYTTDTKYKRTCSEIEGEKKESCTPVIASEEQIEHTKLEYVEYKGEILPPGTYNWRIEGKKGIKEAVDWIGTAVGERLDKWAWWDGDWGYCKDMNITGGSIQLNEFPFAVNVTHNGNMQTDFDDVRFINAPCNGDGTEMPYEIEYKEDSDHMWVWIKGNLSTGTNQFSMYYGNGIATNGEQITEVWTDGYELVMHGINVSGDFRNSVDLTNGSISGSTNIVELYNSSCFIGKCYEFTNSDTGLEFANTGGRFELGYFTQSYWSGADKVLGVPVHLPYTTTHTNPYGSFQNGGGTDIYINVNKGGTYTQVIPGRTGNHSRLGYKSHIYNSTDWDWYKDDEFYYDNSGSNPATYSSPDYAYVGRSKYTGGANDYWDGVIDEARISDHARSEEYHTRSSKNNDPSYFVFGAEQVGNVQPVVTLNSPADKINQTGTSLTFNWTAEDDTQIENSTLYINGVENVTYIHGTSNYTSEQITLNFLDGNYNWYVSATDDVGAIVNSATRIFSIDSTDPELNITFPIDGTTYTDEIANPSGASIVLNWSVSDTNLDSCWYFNQTANVSVTCGTNATFNLPYGSYTHIVYTNDTFGNTNQDSVSVTYSSLLAENSQTFSTPVVEGTLQDFEANVTIDASIEISSATLVYNITNYELGSISSSGQDRILAVDNYMIPDTEGNVTFYWSLNLTNGDVVNLTTQTQEVFGLNLDDCSVYSNELFNITLWDEEDKTPLNGTIELFYEVQNKPDYDTINTLSAEYVGVFGTLVCSDINLSSQNLAYSTEIRYFSDEYATELYHIQRADIDGSLVDIELYDLQLNDTTEFLIEYQDENLLKVEGAIIQLQRKYISENVYEVVEAPLTSADGTAVVHVDLNTNKYKATIVKEGVTLAIFENIVFDCENELSGQCEQNLYEVLDPQNSKAIETISDFSYAITEGNQSIVITFSVPSGTPASINVQLEQVDMFGNSTLCNNTIISSGGSTECTYNKSIGDSFLELKVSKDSVPIVARSYIVPEEYPDFGGNNLFILFLFLISLSLMAVSSPEWMIWNGVITLVVSGALWLVQGMNLVVGLGGLAWIVVAGIIVAIKLGKQEDQ